MLKTFLDFAKNILSIIFGGGKNRKYVQKARDNANQIQIGDIKNGK